MEINMTENEKLSRLVVRLFHLVEAPSYPELLTIKRKAIDLLNEGKELDYFTLFDIVHESVDNCWSIAQEAVDTTSTINIINQIIELLTGNAR